MGRGPRVSRSPGEGALARKQRMVKRRPRKGYRPAPRRPPHPLIFTPCSGTSTSIGTISAATLEPSTAETRSLRPGPALLVDTSVVLGVGPGVGGRRGEDEGVVGAARSPRCPIRAAALPPVACGRSNTPCAAAAGRPPGPPCGAARLVRGEQLRRGAHHGVLLQQQPQLGHLAPDVARELLRGGMRGGGLVRVGGWIGRREAWGGGEEWNAEGPRAHAQQPPAAARRRRHRRAAPGAARAAARRGPSPQPSCPRPARTRRGRRGGRPGRTRAAPRRRRRACASRPTARQARRAS
jgi:hypothetical protein